MPRPVFACCLSVLKVAALAGPGHNGADGRRSVAAALALLAFSPGLSGCILGSERPELNLEVPAHYQNAPKSGADAALPILDWWRGFHSGELTTLMEAAQLSNLDIAVAIAQVVQADAQVGVAGAALLPNVTGTGTAEREHFGSEASSSGSSNSSIGGGIGGRGSTFSFFSAGLTASYIVDFWGKNRALLAASEESASVSRYNREVVTLTTIVTVANTYFQILAAQDQIRVTRRNIAAAERILALIKEQFAGGPA
jgi:outer membrane protein, multidrug efflux system